MPKWLSILLHILTVVGGIAGTVAAPQHGLAILGATATTTALIPSPITKSNG